MGKQDKPTKESRICAMGPICINWHDGCKHLEECFKKGDCDKFEFDGPDLN